MPEGDTVYRTARRLNAALAGSVLTGCDIRVPAYATVDLTGETVQDVASRGKHLLARVGAVTIHSHLKMEGEWRLYRHVERWDQPAYEARIVLQTAEWVAVGFRLGRLEVVPREREDELLGHLGPDLLDPDWADEHRNEAVRRIGEHPERPVAVALLEQRNLAGLGNEYVTELCFLRGMLPTRPVSEADVPAAVDLARRLIVANRDRPARTTTGDLRHGRRTWVYGRADEPCRRCGTRIRRLRLGRTELEQREMYFCPRCQR
jgi:Formamidopyrimidine-DNA glycosylase